MIVTVSSASLTSAPPLPSSASELLLFNPSGFGGAAATLIFSQIVQPTVPSLRRDAAAGPLAVRRTIGTALLTTCVLYLALGTLCALFFQAETRKVISLNWVDYTAGQPTGQASAGAPPWASVLSRWILLLPLFSTSAAYPLYCAALSGNLTEVVPAAVSASSYGRALLSLACALPAILLTWCVRDTALIFSLCGLSGFFISFFVPAFLQAASTRQCVTRWGESGRATPMTTVLSGERVVSLMLFVGFAAFAGIVTQMVVGK